MHNDYKKKHIADVNTDFYKTIFFSTRTDHGLPTLLKEENNNLQENF